MQPTIEESYQKFLKESTSHKAFLHRILPKCTPKAVQDALRKSLTEKSWKEKLPLSDRELDEILALVIDPEYLKELSQTMCTLKNFKESRLEKYLTYENLLRYVFPEACLFVANQRRPQTPIARTDFYSLQ